MRTKTVSARGPHAAITLIGLICAGTAGAQQEALDTRDLPDPQVQRGSCAEVVWERELLAQYPRLAEGCQEVVIVNDQKWARFEAEFVQASRDGLVTLDFNDRQGRSMEQLTLQLPADQNIELDGRDYSLSELDRGQELNLYVPEGIFAFALEPGAPAERLASIVAEPIAVAQAEPVPAPQQRQVVAQRTPDRLPATAGPLPFVALGGLLSLLAGLGLTVTRRLRN